MQILYVTADEEKTPIGYADEDNLPTVGDLILLAHSRDGHDVQDLYEVEQRIWGYLKIHNSTGLVTRDPSIVISCNLLDLDASELPS